MLQRALEEDGYLSGDYLNSEGMKLVAIAARLVASGCPELLPSLRRLRRRASREELQRVIELLEEAIERFELNRAADHG
ncbi:MAG: hypothetical protein ABWK00_06860 [Desulfurococcaceae archaeon]